jgi:hypothetical protein
MTKSVLIIGEDPALIDFSAPDAPPGMSEQKVRDGLEGSRDRLRAAGHAADILYTHDAATVAARASAKLRERAWDVIVIGAGLRTLPPMASQFETLINVLHREAPGARLAFNSQPDDSDAAALRWL